MPEQGSQFITRLLFGLSAIALGILFTLDNLGVARASEVLRWWPAVLVALGVVQLAGFGRRGGKLWGLFSALLGSWLLLHNLGIVHHDIWSLWPILLIFMGIAIVGGGGSRRIWGIGIHRIPRSRHGRRWRSSVYGVDPDSNLSAAWGVGPEAPGSGQPAGAAGGMGPTAGPSAAESPGPSAGAASGGGEAQGLDDSQDGSSFLKVDVLMSSVTRKVASPAFRGGEIAAFMGGADIDLRTARMAGERARLETNLLMGGVNLFVPEDWLVEFQGTTIMGGVEDHSRRPVGEARGRLVITGVVLMGSVVIKN